MGRHVLILSLREGLSGQLSMTVEELEATPAFDACVRARVRRRHRIKSHRVLESQARARAQAVESKLFFCSACSAASGLKSDLKHYEASEGHNDRAAGIAKPAPGKYAATKAKKRAEATDNKTHHCSVCDKTFGMKIDLNDHFATAKHVKRAKDAGVPVRPEEPGYIEEPRRSKMAVYDTQRDAEAVLTRKHYCAVCDVLPFSPCSRRPKMGCIRRHNGKGRRKAGNIRQLRNGGKKGDCKQSATILSGRLETPTLCQNPL